MGRNVTRRTRTGPQESRLSESRSGLRSRWQAKKRDGPAESAGRLGRLGTVQQDLHRRGCPQPYHRYRPDCSPLRDRVIAYIDGFNFYHGMMARGWGRYRWLDFRALLERRILPDEFEHNGVTFNGQELVDVRYFSSMVNHQPEKLARQTKFLRALEGHTEIVPIVGEFEMRRVKCADCGKWYKRPQEKQTDVSIAVHLIADAYEGRMDTVYLICADSDLVPAVTFIRERFGTRVVLIDPPKRHSDDLAALADRHWHFSRTHIASSQLPNPVEHEYRPGRWRRYYMPDEWAE